MTSKSERKNKFMNEFRNKQRNGSIDFWKFMFTILIITYHSYVFLMPTESQSLFFTVYICKRQVLSGKNGNYFPALSGK